MTLRKLIVELEARVEMYNRSLAGSQNRTNEFARSAGASIATIKAVGAAAGVALASAAAGFAYAAKQSIDRADELGKMAKKAGVGVEFFSQLQHAAEQADVPAVALQRSIAMLGKNLVNESKPAMEAFKQLGISIQDPSGKLRALETLIPDIASAFALMEDSPAKTAAAMALFGRTGQDLIPLLDSGSEGLKQMAQESDRLGNTIGTDTANNAEKFNDSLTKLKASIGGVFDRIIASPIVGVMGDWIAKGAEWVAASGKNVLDFLQHNEDIQKSFDQAWKFIKETINPIITQLSETFKQVSETWSVIWAKHGDSIMAALKTAWDIITTVVGGSIKMLGGIIENGLKIINGALTVFSGLVSGDWSKVWQGYQQFIKGQWDLILSIIKGVVGNVVGIIGAFVKGGVDQFNILLEKLPKIWLATWNAIIKTITDKADWIVNKVKGFGSDVTAVFSKMYDVVVGNSIVPDMMDRIGSEFDRLGNVMVKPVELATKAVTTAFDSMLDGTIGKLSRKIPVIGGLVNTLGQSLTKSGLSSVLGGTAVGNLLGLAKKAPAAVWDTQSLSFANQVKPFGSDTGGGGTGLSGLGKSLKSFFTNPWTIGVGAAIGGALLAKHLIGRGREQADKFVGGVQNPFGAQLSGLVDQFNSAKSAGSLTLSDATGIRAELTALVRAYNQQASEFAALGKNQAKVVEQARATNAANFGPGFSRVFDDVNRSIASLTKALPSAGIPQTGLSISASTKIDTAADKFLLAVEEFKKGGAPGGTQDVNVTIDAPLTVHYDAEVDSRELFEEWLENLKANQRGALEELTRLVKRSWKGVVTA